MSRTNTARVATNDPAYLFTVKFTIPSGKRVTIRAWEGEAQCNVGSHVTHIRIDAELVCDGKVIFPRGATYCGLTAGTSLDGSEAKELVTSLFCLKPGDTDDEFFKRYTQEQLDWVTFNGESLDMLKQDRWCDPETGEVRR